MKSPHGDLSPECVESLGWSHLLSLNYGTSSCHVGAGFLSSRLKGPRRVAFEGSIRDRPVVFGSCGMCSLRRIGIMLR